MLSRSQHTQAYKKLGDLYRRWGEAIRLLGPAVQALPQLLIIPVILFIIGLLDNMISSALPLSRGTMPIFGAGIVCIAFAAAVGVYTGYTVLHGCLYPSLSPFQSTLSLLVSDKNLRKSVFRLLLPFRILVDMLFSQIIVMLRQSSQQVLHPGSIPTTRLGTKQAERRVDHNDAVVGRPIFHTRLETYEYDAYHVVIQTLHDDGLLDQAAAALGPMMLQRLPSFEDRLIVATRHEMDTLCYLLSSEVSLRNNLTAAVIIRGCVEGSELSDCPYQCFVLIVRARYSSSGHRLSIRSLSSKPIIQSTSTSRQ